MKKNTFWEEQITTALRQVDHGSEFASKVLDACAYEHGLKLEFIRPAPPWRIQPLRVSTDGSVTRA